MQSANFLIPSPCQHLGPIYSTEITQHPLLHQNLGNPLPPPLIWRHLWMYPNTQCTLNQWQNFCTPGRSMSRTACYHKEEAWRTALQKGHHGRTDSSSPQWTASHSHSHTRGQKFVTQQKGGPKSGRKSWPSLFTKSPFACRILLSGAAWAESRTKHRSDCIEKWGFHIVLSIKPMRLF